MLFRRVALGVAVSLTLVGCASVDQKPQYNIQQTEFNLKIIPNTTEFRSQREGRGHKIYGEAEIKQGECIIRLREYPKFLLHEIRHCIEGLWHPIDAKNTQDGHIHDEYAAEKHVHHVEKTDDGSISVTVMEPEEKAIPASDKTLKLEETK